MVQSLGRVGFWDEVRLFHTQKIFNGCSPKIIEHFFEVNDSTWSLKVVEA
jgi:hypothetical protein